MRSLSVLFQPARRVMQAMTGVASIAMCGCQLAPAEVRPELPTAATYSQEYAGDTAAGAVAATLGWRDYFTDPRLKALIGMALQHNRDLAIAVAQIEEARGLYGIQRADRLPTVAVSADASRARGNAANLGAGASSSAATFIVERYSAGAAVAAFELDFWGRVRNLSRAARSEYLASIEAARAFRLSLIREVAFAYLDWLEAAERIDLAGATLQSRREGLRIARRRLDAGVTSELDFRQAETLLTQAETELAALRLSKAQSENLLDALVGTRGGTALPDASPLARLGRSDALAAGLPSDLLAARPDILAAEERLRAARANIAAARAAFFPSISLTGSYGYASTELDDLVGDGTRTWSFGPTIDVPIFDFGRRRGNLTVAQARGNMAIANYELAIQTGFREVADALAGRRYLADQVAAQERATLAQRRLAQLARTRYREGVESYLAVLDAERSLFAAEQALLQVRRAEAANLVTLYVALGGGVIAGR